MKDERIHIVQAGLNKSTEYAFLLESSHPRTRRGRPPLPWNWHKLNIKRNDERLLYHGIEPHPESYQGLIEDLGTLAQQRYYNVALSDTDGEFEIYDYRNRHGHGTYNDKTAKIKVVSQTIEGFFESSGIEYCHLLALDIEGWEYSALKAYQGRIPIEFMIVEFHEMKNRLTSKRYPQSCDRETFEALCREKGFDITARFVSNAGGSLDYHLERRQP